MNSLIKRMFARRFARLSVRLMIYVMLPLLLPLAAAAGDVDIVADKIVRGTDGVATATGHVEIKRGGETLQADKVRYDAASKKINAEGHVQIHSAQADISAASGHMNSENNNGELIDANIWLPGGEHLKASRLVRINEFTYKVFQPVLTTCPIDHETWHVRASEGVLNQKEGTFTAKHARFEFAGVPLFYSPYWQQATRRKSGFMIPFVSFGRRRGTEWALPYYFAPSRDWDTTFTPHLMTARGLMLETEVRHASTVGREQVNFDGMYDKALGRTRGRIQAEGQWRLPYDLNLSLKGDDVSERNYLADFSHDAAEASTRYLTSHAALSQAFEYGSWNLSTTYNHDLSTANNRATLQQYPDFQSNLALPLFGSSATLHLDDDATRFSNRNGVSDWRVYLHPYATLPLNLLGGGLSTTVTAGMTHTRYWLRQGTVRNPKLTSGEFSVDSSMVFERVNAAKTFQHRIVPRLRYDFNNVSDNTNVPLFDSALSPLRLSNLFSGNRFSGHDRVENAHRVAFLLRNDFATKETPNGAARTFLSVALGAQYNIRSRFNAASPPRAFSNILGSVVFNPIQSLSMSVDGEFDPAQSFWNRITETLAWHSESGHQISATYLVTSSDPVTTSETLQTSGTIKLSEHWKTEGSINYDITQRFAQQMTLALAYTHPCWDIAIQAHRTNRPSGTSSGHDLGASILIGFKGVGSVGSCPQ